MIFDNLPNDLDEDKLLSHILNKFRALRKAIFALMPSECFLRPRFLNGPMVLMLDVEMIEQGTVEARDVCALCIEKTCPFYRMPDRERRTINLKMLNTDGNRKQ